MGGPTKTKARGIKLAGILRCIALFASWLVGFSNLTAQVMITPADGLIRGEAVSILHKFPVDVRDFALEIIPTSAPRRWQVMATIPVAGITTGSGLRDRQMHRKVFLHGKSDTLRYLGQTDGNFMSGSHQVDGRLTINDQTHPQPLTVQVRASTDTLMLWGEIDLSLQAFGIQLSMVQDTLHMEFRFTLPRTRLIGIESGDTRR